MFHPQKRTANQTDYKIIKEKLPIEATSGNDEQSDNEEFTYFLSFLEKNYKTFRKLRSSFSAGTKNPMSASNAMTFLNLHDNIVGILPLIFCREMFRNESSEDGPVLHAFEKANFRLYGLHGYASRSDSYNSILHSLAHEYYKSEIGIANNETIFLKHGKNEIEANSIIEAIEEIVKRENGNKGVEKIVEYLTIDDSETNVNYDKWKNIRYFLARYEHSLLELEGSSFNFQIFDQVYRESKKNDFYSLEHIFAQNIKDDPIQIYNDRQVIRRLGNFMLVPHGINIDLSNKDFDKKLGILRKGVMPPKIQGIFK